MKIEEATKIKFEIFCILGFLIWSITPNGGRAIYLLLLAPAFMWLFEEMKTRKAEEFSRALKLGVFLMVFDFIIENAGGILGLWTTHQSIFPIGFVPIEIIFLTIIGGSAWALNLPEKITKNFILTEAVLFGIFGALGEWLLIQNGLMRYYSFWTPVQAAAGYFFTWLILFWVWNNFLKK